MKKTVKKMLQWLTTAIFTLALVLGISITLPTAELAQAETAVVFSAACLGDAANDTYGTSIRFDTQGLKWNTSHNWVDAEAWKSIADYTTVNGRTVTEINEATTNGQKITLMMQPADTRTFSFLRLYIPAEIISIDDVKAMGILEGWSFNNGTATYTAPAVTFLRSGDAMIESGAYSELTKKTSADITIGTAQLVNPTNAGAGTDSYIVNIDMGMKIASEYDTMYNGYKSIRRAIYINGKSIEEWNAQKIAEDARFNDPSTYTRFPQNSSDASHKDYFVKPIGLWGTETGLRLSIFQELVADVETVTVTVGEGCMLAGSFMVAETVTKTVHTQEVVNVVNELTFLDNSHDAPKDWGATNLYYIHTNNKSRWTKAPVGGCLNEADPASQGGGQIQMKYIYFNDISVWELNQKYNGAYGSTQGNIASDGRYAPILVEMRSEVGSSLKLTVPTAFDGTEAGNSGGTAAQNHRTITIKKGFSVYENGVSYYVSNDITFTNNNGTWTKKVTPIEYETEVTGIATYANRTDGATNDNFIIFNLSNHDYEGVREQPILDLSGLLNKIVIGVNTVTTTPSSPYFNVWGIGDSIAFRAPGLDASGVAEIETITIKAGAKFPSYQAQYNGGAIVYYVTTEDVTFYHNVPNDEWSLTPYAKTYTVTFLNEDGTTYETQRVKEGKQATAPVAPTKPSTFDEKYTFNGWYNGNVLFDFNAPITEDVTLTVNFTASATEPVHADVSVTGVKYGYNGTFISFLLSTHDATGLVTDLNGEPYKYDVAASGLLNFIEINGNPLLELVPKTNNFNPHFNVYDATKHDLSIRLPETFDFGAIQTVTVKEGAQFPSLAFLNKTEKKYYTTTEDVTYIVYGDGMMSGDALKDTVTEMDVEVTGIVYRPTSDWTNAQKDNANFLMFKLKGHDYLSVAEMGSNKPVSVATLLNIGFFNQIELYGHEYGETAGTERRLGTFAEIIAAYGQPGEAYINLWGMDNSFGIRLPYNTANDIKDSLYGHTTITKVVIKSGAQFPSYQKFVAGATDSDYRLVSRAETTFVWNESWGMFTKEDKSSGIWMEKGASVRLGGSSSSVNNNTSGIRFTTTVSNDWLHTLDMGVAVGTYQSYLFGTLITPTDYLVGGVFTHQWLDTQNHETNYLDIQSTGWAIEDEETNTRSYHGSIVKLLESNYARQFSGVGYVRLVMKDGSVKYVYAPYETSSARAAEYVAKAAIADKDGDYTTQQKEFLQKYIVTSVGITTGRLNASTMANFDLHGLNAGASKTLTTNVTLNGPYIVLEYNSYYNMLVTFNYTNNGVTVNEEAYLPAGSTVHKQFFDVFRTHNGSLGKGKFDTSKSFTLNSITFKNVDNKTGAANLVDFTSFTLEDKGYDSTSLQIYLTKEFNGYDVTIGAHLGLGGSLTYLAKSGIAEYKYTTTTTEGSSWNQKTITTEYVGIGVAPSGTTILRKGTSSKPAVLGGDGVNLINNYDKGRQIQQAWYGDIGSEYKRGTYNNNSQWPYNPVQAGDKGDNASQIIDYEIGENYIYVKARAMDWAMPNDTPVTTKSYMENWYRINDDGTVRVDNAFVDWNGFKDTGGFTSNELPAFYTVQSMNYFVSNTSMSKDDAWTGSLKYYNPGSWNEGNDTAVHQFRAPQEGTDVNGNSLNKGKFENWFAWASGNTESALAIGCYMPNVEKFTSGRTEKTSAVKMVQKPKWGSETTTTYDKNNNASSSSVKNLSGMDPAAYNEMSCYVQNCSYTAPGTSYKMAEYVPISYSYVIMVDTVTNIRANFQVLESSGTLTNEGLNAWLREGQS